MRLGIFGAGFSGRTIGALAARNGASVWGTSRSVERFEDLRAGGIDPMLFDGDTLNAALLKALAETTHLVISVAPPRKEDLTNTGVKVDPILAALADRTFPDLAPKLKWVGYLSTVGVYGNHDGAWVDEETPVKPVSERSRQRVRSEAEWLALGEATHLPIGIFRLSGIYGPGRNALLSAQTGKARRLVKPGQVFNRIHVDDIAQGLWNAAERRAQGIFNITDQEPAPPQDVVAFAHDLMGIEPPPEVDFDTADLTSMARSFYGENKRVSNARSRHELDLAYASSDYRTTLTRMWKDGTWRGREGE
jgi:nucleoside-diphosphate-sugar epimerase